METKENLFKICKLCEKVLEANFDNFYKKPKGKYGLNSVCIPCQKIRRKKSYLKKHFTNKKRLRKYYYKNKDKYRSYANRKVEIISDCYIRKLLRDVNCSEELVYNKKYLSAYREQIKIKRLIKQIEL